MPEKINKIADAIGLTINTDSYNSILKNKELLGDVTITKVEQLFPRIEEILLQQAPEVDVTKTEVEKKDIALSSLEELEGDNLITIDTFFGTSLQIGTVIDASEVPKSKKLLKLQVDLGESRPRQILAGIKEFYDAKDLINTQVCVVANLKPAKLMGMISEGMLLAARDENGLSLIRPEAPKKIGTKIS